MIQWSQTVLFSVGNNELVLPLSLSVCACASIYSPIPFHPVHPSHPATLAHLAESFGQLPCTCCGLCSGCLKCRLVLMFCNCLKLLISLSTPSRDCAELWRDAGARNFRGTESAEWRASLQAARHSEGQGLCEGPCDTAATIQRVCNDPRAISWSGTIDVD